MHPGLLRRLPKEIRERRIAYTNSMLRQVMSGDKRDPLTWMESSEYVFPVGDGHRGADGRAHSVSRGFEK